MQLSHATIVFTDAWSTFTPEPSLLIERVFIDNESVGIAEVRNVTAEAHRRPVSGEKKLIVVRASKLTVEAQQALLKTLEEPPTTSAIIIALPIGTTLLPTILSRVVTEHIEPTVDTAVFDEWVNSPLADRLAQVEVAAKDKNEGFFIAMSQGLRAYLARKRQILPPAVLTTAHQVLTLLRTRGASNKMLLEELALSLPVSSR